MTLLRGLLLICGTAKMVASGFVQDVDTVPEISKNIFDKRASNVCPSSNYTTPNGQTFSTTAGNAGCNKDLPENDITSVSQDNITSITDCMDWCSVWGGGVAYGVVYEFQSNPGVCFCKGSGVLTTDFNPDEYVHSALAVNVNLNPDLQCPYGNATTQVAADGSQFEIHCNQNMPNVNDLCPTTSPSAPIEINNLCPTHADSLHDCMNQCGAAHPICLAVIYFPSMSGGYGNCFFKSNVSAANFIPTGPGTNTSHMAVLSQNAWNTNSTCVNGTTYRSASEAEFEISCDVDQPSSNDLVQFHMQNMSACADACATYTNSSGVTCEGVVFDSSMVDGYENCYFKNNVAPSLPGYGGRIWAQLTRTTNGSSANSSSGDTAPPNSTLPSPSPAPPPPSSSSKAWVAGPVIGGLAAVAAVAGLLSFLRRRRRPSSKSAAYTSAPDIRGPVPPAYSENTPPAWQTNENGFKFGFNQQPMPQPGPHQIGMQQQQYLAEADSERQMQELGGNPVPAEMPGSK